MKEMKDKKERKEEEEEKEGAPQMTLLAILVHVPLRI